MQNIKYHTINIIAVILFSYVTAVTINLFIRNSLVYYPSEKSTRKLLTNTEKKTVDIEISQILETGFFPDSSVESSETAPGDSKEPDAALTDLKLLGTITGSDSMTMAFIMKRGDKQPALYKLKSTIGGYRITSIQNNYIVLKKNNETFKLLLYEKKEISQDKGKDKGSDVPGESIKRTISRAEVQQRIMNDLDKAMEGIKGGPYKVNDKIEGFRIIRIQPTNILYEYGMRNGDIIKRINGKKIDSTEKMLNIWQGFKSETKLVIDVERNGQMITFDITITD